MPEAIDTVTPEVPETVAPEVNGTESADAGATVTPVVTETPVPDPAEVERLQKELNKAQQEINLRRNQQKELETAQATAERERIAKESDAEVRASFYQKQLEEREALDATREEERVAAEQQKEVDTFRDKIISEYPQSVQDLAKTLGTNWDDAADYPGAEAQLRAKLDAIKAIVPSTPDEGPEIHPNNPSSDPGLTEIDKLKNLSAKELRKLLPIASDR